MKIASSEHEKIKSMLNKPYETIGIFVPNQNNTAWLLRKIPHKRRTQYSVHFDKSRKNSHLFHTHPTTCDSLLKCAYDPPSRNDLVQMMSMSQTTSVSVVFSKKGIFVVRFKNKACAGCKRDIPKQISALQKKILPGNNYNKTFVRLINGSCCINCRWYRALSTACIPRN